MFETFSSSTTMIGVAEDGPRTKRRRLKGSCDTCKTKRIRCDSAKMPGGICSSCLEFDIDCKHENKSKWKPALTPPQVGLANHSPVPETLEFFRRHRPIRATVASILSSTTPYIVPKEYSVIRLTLVELAVYIGELEKALEAASAITASCSPNVMPTASAEPNEVFLNEGALLINEALSGHLQSMSLEQSRTRFYGRSSNLMLLKSVITVRKEFIGQQELSGYPRRAQYWRIQPWQLIPEPMPIPLTFPESDLLHDLTDLYFFHFNQYIPLLHKPTFDGLIQENMHLVNHQFGMTVLGVIAIGARYSYDPRVLEDEVDAGYTELGVGWKYYRQISVTRTSFVKPTSIYELQLHCLCILYEQGTSTPESCWMHLGAAVRFLQDVGLHRKAPNNHRTVETELWKRAFWVIACIDIMLSTFLGRPRAMNTDDYDQDPPAECDDEYWDHSDPEQAFKQPAGKPSKLTYWLNYMKLLEIMAFSQRTIYSVNKPRSPLDSSPKWDINDVVKIDSALNAWVDSLPDHLRWDPHREDMTLFNQSCIIYVAYYYTQILVHRPFIPSPGSPPMANMSFPSLAICANAARSCCHVMDVQSRKSFLPMPNVMIPLATSALILLLNHWGGKRFGLSSNPGKEYADVYKCINVLHHYDKRWQVAGRLCDLLEQLLNFDTEKSVNKSSLKRFRDSEIAQETYETQVPPQMSSVSAAPSITADNTQDYELLLYNLPFSTNELGRLPIHGLFDFVDMAPGVSQPGSILFEDPELLHIIESMDPTNETYGPGMNFVPIFPQSEEYSWGDWSTGWPQDSNI
ncbi:fungal-specific transcription factor domain-containing protein [Mycena floridula]|nr:fungal-specific transcription factor domain-containing protein [Mycena floridula]